MIARAAASRAAREQARRVSIDAPGPAYIAKKYRVERRREHRAQPPFFIAKLESE
jgi:hypothetical protein